ncbi:nitroreductase family protein [Pseudokineococcus basanitobsidens]|uniref:Nitroreductase family protein n=1 Tax=Pseudokineococcus basanitobsidens TaxID=1926649 RepID=A0ABU8RJE7_9ACTN
MQLLDAIRDRRTTNGAFLPDPVSEEHQRLLVTVAGAAPSHFNSQPWRFVLVDDRATIDAVADLSAGSMETMLSNGTFFERYKPYFRFSAEEMERRRDGMHIDQLPAALRPFTRAVFTGAGQSVMNRLRVPRTLAQQNRELVAGSPLLLAVCLDRSEYRPGELSGFYSVFGMGAAVENIWLTTVELGMGIQFVSFPMELPEAWASIERMLAVPDDLELMAVYRLGYVPEEARRPKIDWSSRQRRRLSQYVYRGTFATPMQDEPPA